MKFMFIKKELIFYKDITKPENKNILFIKIK